MVVSGGGGSQPATQLCGMDREARVLRYREKRKNRKFEKTIFHPGYDLMSSYANKRRQGIFWRVRIRLRKVVYSVWMADVWHRTLFLKWWLLAGCSYSIWVFLQIFRFGAPLLGLWGSSVCIDVIVLN